MAEYINRDTVINKRRRMSEYDEAGWCVTCQAVRVEDIENTPSADVVEVVHAWWQWSKVNGQYGYYCSNCQAGWADSENAEWIAKSHDYCPKCGAKMDGERRLDE